MECTIKIEFLTLLDDTCPVADFILSLDDKTKKKIIRTFDLFEKNPLGYIRYSDEFIKMPGYEKYDLWEFRIYYNKIKYRILCSLRKARCYLVHAFIKKGRKTPTREINVATDRIQSNIYK